MNFIDKLIKPVTELVSEFVEDKDKQNEFKAKLYAQVLDNDGELIKASAGIIEAEAKSESWLTANWRPVTMVSFLGLLWSYWLGYAPENLSQETLTSVFDLLKIGLGGYVVGRSGEKIVKEYKK
jgi:hypothetical protein